MKNNILKTLLILLSTTLIMSCSDKEETQRSETPNSREIVIITETSSENNEAILYLKGTNIEINWGDGTVSKSTDRGVDMYPITHNYSQLGRKYIISVTAERLASFGNTSKENILSRVETKVSDFNIKVGDNLSIPEINIQTSGIESFSFLEAASNINIYANSTKNISLNNLLVEMLSINVNDKVQNGNIEIKECNQLEALYLSGPNKYPNKLNTYINNLTINSLPRLSKISLDGFITKSLNINNTGNSDVYLIDVGVENPVVFSNILKTLTIKETYGGVLDTKGISSIDISECEKLEKLIIVGSRNLKEIKTGDKLINLKEVDIKGGHFENLTFKNLPKFNSFIANKGVFGMSAGRIDISNNPNLELLNLQSISLKQINTSNSPKLGDISLDKNLLEENEIRNILNSLNDCLKDNGGIKRISTMDNPGHSLELRKEAREKLKYWTFY